MSRRSSLLFLDIVADEVEREMGFEPTTFCLGSRRSTSELLPLFMDYKIWSI